MVTSLTCSISHIPVLFAIILPECLPETIKLGHGSGGQACVSTAMRCHHFPPIYMSYCISLRSQWRVYAIWCSSIRPRVTSGLSPGCSESLTVVCILVVAVTSTIHGLFWLHLPQRVPTWSRAADPGQFQPRCINATFLRVQRYREAFKRSGHMMLYANATNDMQPSVGPL